MKGENAARLHEALSAGMNGKNKDLPAPDGVLTVTPDIPEAADWRSRRSPMDVPCTGNILRDDDDGT